MSHKMRSERIETECWRGFCVDLRVMLGRHPVKTQIQRSPRQRRDSGAQ